MQNARTGSSRQILFEEQLEGTHIPTGKPLKRTLQRRQHDDDGNDPSLRGSVFVDTLASLSDTLKIGHHGAILGPTWAKMGPSWTNLEPTWANMRQLGANLGFTCITLGATWGQHGANLAPTWSQLGREVALKLAEVGLMLAEVGLMLAFARQLSLLLLAYITCAPLPPLPLLACCRYFCFLSALVYKHACEQER